MEKIVLISDGRLDEVNGLLEEGWSVKLIESTSSEGYRSAYVVLEKQI